MLKALRVFPATSFFLAAIFSFSAQIFFSAQLFADQPPAATAPVSFPLAFEINRGQTAPQVHYLARSREGTLFFTDGGVTISIPHQGSFRVLFEGANAVPAIAAEQPLITRSNYLDRDPAKSISGVENFGALRYAEV